MPDSIGRNLIAASLLFAILDVGAAQIFKRTLEDVWDPEASERSYRVPISHFHHGLVEGVELDAYWGGTRYPYATNSLGFRDGRVREVPVRSGNPRVLVIGDSFTEGIGVPFPETYVGRLERRLGADQIEVLNAGVSSYAPAVYYRKVRHLIEEVGLDFDVLLVGLDISDIADEELAYRFSAAGEVLGIEPPSDRAARTSRFFKNNSLLIHVGTMAKFTLDRRAAAGSPESLGLGRPRALWTTDQQAFAAFGASGLKRARESMDRLHELTSQRGIAMAVLVYPWPDQIAHADRDSYQVSFWKTWADSSGVPLYNAFPPFFEGASAEETIRHYFIPFDVHWNAEGHRVIEEVLVGDGFPEFVRRSVAADAVAALP